MTSHSFYFHSALLLWCFGVAVPTPHSASRPCEREGVRRLRHSLGCFSTLVPWAEKASPPIQPLSLRSPDPTSWYSGFCPCLPGTVFFSSPSHSFCLTLFLLCHWLTSYLCFFAVLPNPRVYCVLSLLFNSFPSTSDFRFSSVSWLKIKLHLDHDILLMEHCNTM